MSQIDVLQKAIHKEIPIAAAMGARVLAASSDHVTISAPLAPNTNHKSTAFGGSVYSIAVLSCWALMSEALREKGVNVDYVVVQDGQMDYASPVSSDFTAESSWPSLQEKEKFFTTLLKKGRARASLVSTVKADNFERARLQARFAAQIVKS